MNSGDYEYLKSIMELSTKRSSVLKAWINSDDTVHTVASILKEEGVLNTVSETIEYFYKPWHWEPEVEELIRLYRQDSISRDFYKVSVSESDWTLDWIWYFLEDEISTLFLEYLDIRPRYKVGL